MRSAEMYLPLSLTANFLHLKYIKISKVIPLEARRGPEGG